MGAKPFPLKHVVESQQFDRDVLDLVMETAQRMKADVEEGGPRYSASLAGKIMASLFYEPSTRTRFSFETAMHRLGGRVITTENAKEFSSAAKGESLRDTILVINGYADAIVMRHHQAGSAQMASEISRIPVINAGDGPGQHPTQALLDLFTIRDSFDDIGGISIAMVGDLKYGRTVRSLCYLLTKYEGVRVFFVSPPVCRMDEDIKAYLDRYGVSWREESDLNDVLAKVDCLYMTRIQKERFNDLKDYEEASGKYVLSAESVSLMQPGAIVMHPLPRVDEIATDVDADSRAKYFQQAHNGVFVRMALLYLLLGGRPAAG
jgi:aspartate carbamoyltransferase catalytic subunit